MSNGESATAEVEVEGSSLNGQGVEVELVEEGGNWKLNKFLGFTNFDAAALAEALEEELDKEEGVDPKLAKCVVRRRLRNLAVRRRIDGLRKEPRSRSKKSPTACE